MSQFKSLNDFKGETIDHISGLKNGSIEPITFHFENGSVFSISGKDDESAIVIFEPEITPRPVTIFNNSKQAIITNIDVQYLTVAQIDDFIVTSLTITVIAPSNRKFQFPLKWCGSKKIPTGDHTATITINP